MIRQTIFVEIELPATDIVNVEKLLDQLNLPEQWEIVGWLEGDYVTEDWH